MLKRDWKPELGIKDVLMTVRCLLVVPNAESALNEEAGKLLLEDYEAFAERARMMTDVHARTHSAAKKDRGTSALDATDAGPDALAKKARVEKKQKEKKKNLKRL